LAWRPSGRGVLADKPVYRLPDQVGVPGVPAVLLDQVAQQPPQAGVPAIRGGDVDELAQPAIAQGGAQPGAGPSDCVVPQRIKLLGSVAGGVWCWPQRPGRAFYALTVETLTFLFTDIEGSTALLRRLGEDVYAQALAGHHSLIRSGLADHEGKEVGTRGDAFFAVFSSPRACVAAAAQMQQALAAYRWPEGERVRVRMGVHTGEAAQTVTGLVGLDVHRAARVAGVAYGGQVLLSETAAALVRDSLPPGVALRDLGAHRLKDLGRPEQIFQLDVAGLQAEFPPLRSLGNPALPNNLPAQLATFIGRERELADVRGLVGSCRLVTLTGAGGSGKTRLGLQVAAELLDGSGDGVWLVELADISDEDSVAPAICRALRIDTPPGRPVPETLLNALAMQDVLIVLDNCEHLIGACAKSAEAIVRRCPRVHLVATSREPLGLGGETIYRVPPLSLPGPGDGGFPAPGSSDAVTLFLERAKEQGAGLPADEETGRLVVSVCARLDGMPLAIELAAARLRSLSLAALHDRLDQRFRLLTGGSRTALGRQQTLEATVDWSYSLLNGAEQLLLRRLSVFAGGFDLEAAEAVGGFGDIQVLDVTGLLGSLVDKSLVVAERTGGALRYRLLETIRQFAAERLAGAGADEAAAVAAAHSGHFLAVTEAAAPHLDGPDQGEWLARLDAEQANLRRAAGYAAGRPDGTAQVLRFGAALRKYWMARSRNEEALSLLVPVLQRPDARMEPWLFGEALTTAATLAQFHDMAAARQLGEQAVGFARQRRDDQLLSYSLMVLAGVYYFAGEPERGLPLAEESVQCARRLGDDVQLAGSLMVYLVFSDHIGLAHDGQLFAEAIACTERSGDRFAACLLHNNAGSYALQAGDIPAARAHLEQAAQAMQEIGLTSYFVPVNLGWVLREEGDLPGARSRFEEGLQVSRRNGVRSGLAYASLGLACLTADAGDWYGAGQLHGIAQVFLDRIGECWQGPETRYRQDSLSQVRSALGAEQFERAYAQGQALSSDQALDLALETARPA
jgi:predicted ATPase/class 3 adenylate cyclase